MCIRDSNRKSSPIGVAIAPALSGSLCARYVSVAALEPFTILRSFPLPYFSVTPSGNAAISVSYTHLNYETWVIAYTKGLRLPMMFYTTAINSVFAFLIAGGILFTRGGVTNELLLNLIFYIVITPVIGTTLTKIMFMSEDAMIVGDAIDVYKRQLKDSSLTIISGYPGNSFSSSALNSSAIASLFV